MSRPLRLEYQDLISERRDTYVELVYSHLFTYFSGVKVLHCSLLYLPLLLILPSPNPPPSCSPSSPVTLAFSPNVNPNRLSTEGYCSSSQKRRQIFRYWGAADLDLCVAMPIFFESGLVMIVVTCGGFFLYLLGVVGWLMAIPALHRGASHGPCMAALWFHWGLIDLLTSPPIHLQLHLSIKFLHCFHSNLFVLWLTWSCSFVKLSPVAKQNLKVYVQYDSNST